MTKIFFILSLFLFSHKSCSSQYDSQSSDEEVKRIDLKDDSINTKELLSGLIFKIENNDFSYLSDTLYGECLVYAFGKYDEESMEAEDYILKREVEENPQKLENYQGTNLKEGLLKELYSFLLNQKSLVNNIISVSMINSEFDSSCIFEFIIVDNQYKLIRVYGVG